MLFMIKQAVTLFTWSIAFKHCIKRAIIVYNIFWYLESVNVHKAALSTRINSKFSMVAWGARVQALLPRLF